MATHSKLKGFWANKIHLWSATVSTSCWLHSSPCWGCLLPLTSSLPDPYRGAKALFQLRVNLSTTLDISLGFSGIPKMTVKPSGISQVGCCHNRCLNWTAGACAPHRSKPINQAYTPTLKPLVSVYRYTLIMMCSVRSQGPRLAEQVGWSMASLSK